MFNKKLKNEIQILKDDIIILKGNIQKICNHPVEYMYFERFCSETFKYCGVCHARLERCYITEEKELKAKHYEMLAKKLRK